MAALFFPLAAGELSLLLNAHRPFRECTAALLESASCGSPDALVATVVLLLQAGLLPSDCQQMQALHLLAAARSLVGTAVLLQAAGCEAASPVVRGLALCLLAEGGSGGTIAGVTPQEFQQSFDPGCVLEAPTLLDLQLQHWGPAVAGLEAATLSWLPDAAAVRAAVLPAAQAAALRLLGLWASAAADEVGGLDNGGVAVGSIARLAAAVLDALYAWAATLRQLPAPCQPLSPGKPGQEAQLPQQQEPPEGEAQWRQPALADSLRPVEGAVQREGQWVWEEQPPGCFNAEAAAAIAMPQGSSAGGDGRLPAANGAAKPAHDAQEGAAAGHGVGSSACNSSAEQDDHARLASLLSQAQRFPLLPGDQRQLVAGLKASPAAVVACRADLEEYRGLIENNPLVAAWLLIAINWHAQRAQQFEGEQLAEALAVREELDLLSKSIPNYLAVLCTLPMSNHSMECMTTLVDAAPPPPTVLAVFVANAIRTIDGTQEAARQARLAKLLCAFLQHLFDRGQEGVVPAVYADVQAFCIAWSRLKEAAALFKRLKAFEGEGGGAAGLGGVGSPGTPGPAGLLAS